MYTYKETGDFYLEYCRKETARENGRHGAAKIQEANQNKFQEIKVTGKYMTRIMAVTWACKGKVVAFKI